jgi:predicted XRE-type DNA-binding protein
MGFKGWLKTNEVKYEDIAKLLGISKSTVSNKINGFSDFLLYEISTIVSEYGTSYDIFKN